MSLNPIQFNEAKKSKLIPEIQENFDHPSVKTEKLKLFDEPQVNKKAKKTKSEPPQQLDSKPSKIKILKQSKKEQSFGHKFQFIE